MELQTVLRKLTPVLVSFLNDTLPKICENWWNECVINKLSDNQKREIAIRNFKTLESLDLAALLRIINNNWREISENKKLPVEVRIYTNEVLHIRNKYAHSDISKPNKEDEFRDFDTIQRLISAIDKNNKLIEEVKILMDPKPSTPIREIIYEPDIQIENKEKQDENSSFDDQSVGILVKKYIPKILEYCCNIDISELDKLKNKDYSKKRFGINYPFMIEVKNGAEKIDRYWKTIYAYKNRYFVVTSEWYKWNKTQFLEYLHEKQLIQFNISEIHKIDQLTHSNRNLKVKSKSPHNIVEEREKVEKKIPKWFKSKSQINSQIIIKYLELLGINEFVYLSELESKLKQLKTFQSNYNQMKNFGEKNHAKVFDESNGKIYLWPPIKEFILEQYRCHN